MKKPRFLNPKEMESIARKATRETLKNHVLPSDEEMENLTLGIMDDEEHRIFILYIAGETPLDAKTISEARVNRRTGQVEVQVFLPRKP